MTTTKSILAAVAAGLLAQAAFTGAAHAATATPFAPLANEAPATLTVEPLLAEPLARGVAVIPYRTENFRILPIFGAAAVAVSPRAGHLHVTVDDLPWHWADAGAGNTVVVAALPPGSHKVLIELALPDHKVIAAETVAFTVPGTAAAPHTH
jgi:hypothetical protein